MNSVSYKICISTLILNHSIQPHLQHEVFLEAEIDLIYLFMELNCFDYDVQALKHQSSLIPLLHSFLITSLITLPNVVKCLGVCREVVAH